MDDGTRAIDDYSASEQEEIRHEASAAAHPGCEVCDDSGCLAECCSNPLVVVDQGRGWTLYAHQGKCADIWNGVPEPLEVR